jgi:DNA-3-methyladenine glycosylase
MSYTKRLNGEFFRRDVLSVAPGLLGKIMVIKQEDLPEQRYIITDVEAYRGEEDKACHASKGRTARTEIMFGPGGSLYVYLIYGMYWMLNIVTGEEDEPQAVLIRGVENCTGPGRLTRLLGIDGSFNGEDLSVSRRIWIEDAGLVKDFRTGMRIGIDYAGEYWKTRPWRYYMPALM